MRFVRRLVILGLIVTLLPLAASLGYARLWVEPDHQPAAAIIVLSGPGGKPEGIDGETLARMERAIELFNADRAPLLILSGGSSSEISAAEAMRNYAVNEGVPDQRILLETRSRSTLQNGEFVGRMRPDLLDKPVIIVSHRYHMLRSLASFRWAGFKSLQAAVPDDRNLRVTRSAVMEAFKWPFNAIRGGIGRLALALGVPPETVDPFLQ